MRGDPAFEDCAFYHCQLWSKWDFSKFYENPLTLDLAVVDRYLLRMEDSRRRYVESILILPPPPPPPPHDLRHNQGVVKSNTTTAMRHKFSLCPPPKKEVPLKLQANKFGMVPRWRLFMARKVLVSLFSNNVQSKITKYKLHNHIYTWVIPDDTLLAVAREHD